jgi:hypothetical protein
VIINDIKMRTTYDLRRTSYVAQASLFAEDEPDLGKAVQSALIRSGYVVDWVQDGDTAWEYL